MADIILNRPNWLGSAERLVRKHQVPEIIQTMLQK